MTKQPCWKELADAMSEISELAFHAGWMDGLEYRLWEITFCDGERKYGQIAVSDEQISKLRALSNELQGWVWFCDESGVEQFIGQAEWVNKYRDWKSPEA